MCVPRYTEKSRLFYTPILKDLINFFFAPSTDFHAAFGDFGNALVITLMKDGDGYSVIGAEFGHTALKHMGASATGVLDVKDVKAANGRLSGKLVSGADADIFGEPIKVDLAFDVKLP